MYAIVAQNLKKRFENTFAVDDVSFNVKKGEVFGFLGPNGAGKTTTIRMLTGILMPDAGSVFIEGISLKEDQAKAKMKIGVIPEVGNVYADLSAKQNLYLTGKFYGMGKKEIEYKSNELLASLGLFERKDDVVRTFSKGMRQRVSIACAMIHDPEILFLDEPTEGLDVHSKRLITTIINDYKAKGNTIFLTTHNIEEANMLCEKVCIINKGKIVAINSPEALKNTFDDTQSIEVSFESPIKNEFIDFSQISNIEKYGDKLRLYTNNPDLVVKHVVSYAQKNNITIVSLTIRGPSLEEAFVKLTGDNQ